MVLRIDALRSADWLTAERARAWCRILAAITIVSAIAWVGLSSHGVDKLGKPLGTDFVSFWSAGRLALQGQTAAPYQPTTHAAYERAAFPTAAAGYYAFFYPPVALLLLLPFALMPYAAALATWLSSTGLLVFVCLRNLLPQRWALLPILSFPAVILNAGHGQNGFLSAACFGGSMLLRRRPLLAGMCLGALVFKPQLALAVPVGLIAARRWQMVSGAVLSAAGLCALSWLILGNEAWSGFFTAAPLARETLEAGLVDPAKMVSTFAGMRVLHSGLGAAYAAQMAVTIGTAILLARTLARRPGGLAEAAMLSAAALLGTPFLLDYDLMILAPPLAWVTAEAQRTGWRAWEKVTLLIAYALPLLSRVIATELGIPVAPLVLAGLLAVVMRRAGGCIEQGSHGTYLT